MNIARKKPSITAMNLSLLIKYYLSLKRKKPVKQREMLKIEIIPNQFVLYSINTSPFFLPFAYTEKGSDIDHSRSVVLTIRRINEPKPTIINIFWRLFTSQFNTIISLIVVTHLIQE